MASKSEQLSFEEAYQKLESITSALEGGEMPLEESMKAFEEGINLAKYCAQKLSQAEAKLQRLVKHEDGRFSLELMD